MSTVLHFCINLPAMLLAAWALFTLQTVDSGAQVQRVPLNQGQRDAAVKIDLSGEFQRFDGKPGQDLGSWPAFRGAKADNIVQGGPALAEDWGEDGPPVLWSMHLGDGHAGPAVRDGKMYLLDYDEEELRDQLRCFNLEDGTEIWRRSYPVAIKRNHGISRTVPTLAGKQVVSIGPKCHVLCCDAETGDFRWGIDLVREHGSKVPLWYTAQCPLVDGNTVVLAPGGPDALLLGVDLRTGEAQWHTPNPNNWQMSHAVITKMTLHGVPQYVYPAIGGVVGISAVPGHEGELLWTSTDWTLSVVAPSPVQLSDNRILLTAGYGAGSIILQIKHDGQSWNATASQSLSVEEFACEQQTPIVHDGLVFTIMPKDAKGLRQQVVAIDEQGQFMWSSGAKMRYGLGPFLLADDKLIVLDDRGTLSLLQWSQTGCKLLTEHRMIKGRDAWAPMALVDGRLLMRDDKTMLCVDLRANP